MVRHMPYIQLWKGSYRFRRRVPDLLKPIIGKPEWIAALGTKSKAEANRLVVPHIGRTDQIIRGAERVDYPPLQTTASSRSPVIGGYGFVRKERSC